MKIVIIYENFEDKKCVGVILAFENVDFNEL